MPVSHDIRRGDAQVLDWGRANNLTRVFIQDSAKRWADNQWQGHYVRIRGGLNDCASAVISSNSENRLHLQGELPVTPSHEDESAYEILTSRLDSSTGTNGRLDELETRMSEILVTLRQIREGITILVERDLASLYPDA